MTAAARRIGLALGSGSARGWAHIGVIRALEKAGIRPDIVAGCSIGALVGAAYAASELDRLERWALAMRKADVVGLMDMSLGGGLVKGERLMASLRREFDDRPIDQLRLTFGAVATSLYNGCEVWLREGSTLDAVRASISVPGLFEPVRKDGALLVDGGLVDPVPVSLARAMGAELVIAVDLGSDILGRRFRPAPAASGEPDGAPPWARRVKESLRRLRPPFQPSPLDVLLSSLEVVEVRVARSRLAGDPPDVLVAPRLAHFRLLEFHRAKEAIEEGARAVERVGQALAELNA